MVDGSGIGAGRISESAAEKALEVKQTPEIQEAQAELNQATHEAPAKIEASQSIETAEKTEAEFKTAMEAVAAAAPAADRGPETEKAAEAAADRRPETEDGSRETGDQEGSSAVQDVSRSAAPNTGEDYSTEMTGAQPGEVRGLVPEEDGTKTYELKTDGQTETQTVQEQVESLEAAQGIPAESAEAVTLRPEGETASPVEEESAESGEVQRGDELEAASAPTLGVESAGEDSATAAASKVVSGGGAPAASGLPTDDAPEGSMQDAASADETREPVSAPVEREPSSSDAAAELDPNAQAQDVLDEAFAEQTEDLEFYAEKVQMYNAQKEAVRSYTEDLRTSILPETSPESLVEGLSLQIVEAGSVTIAVAQELPTESESESRAGDTTDSSSDRPAEPQIEDYITGTDDDGNPIIDQEAYDAAMTEYQNQLATWEDQGESIAEDSDATEQVESQLAAVLEAIHSALKSLDTAGEQLKSLRTQLASLKAELVEIYDEIEIIQDYIKEISDENDLLANALDTLGEGDTVTLTVSADPASQLGDFNWNVQEAEMDRGMIEVKIAENSKVLIDLQKLIAEKMHDAQEQQENIMDKEQEISKLLERMTDISNHINALQQQAQQLSEVLGKEYTPQAIPASGSTDTTPLPASPTAVSGSAPSQGPAIPLDD
ncbi:MAG: hypothetical protein ACK2TT_11455 [Anaerolineales bacterium]